MSLELQKFGRIKNAVGTEVLGHCFFILLWMNLEKLAEMQGATTNFPDLTCDTP